MILALGSLGLVAALNWQPLTLLLDTLFRWPNVSTVMSQVALISCAAGSCVMITSAASERRPTTIRRIAVIQYGVAAVIAMLTLVAFFTSPQQPEMAPQEYLRRNLGSGAITVSWLLPLLYVMLALTLVAWAGMRHSNRTRRGRALFVFTTGVVLIVLASAFFLLRAVGTTEVRRRRRRRHPAGLRHARRGQRIVVAQRRGLVRRAARTAGDPASVGRTESAASQRRDRGTPPGTLAVPRGRADVADLRRAVPGGHAGTRRRATPQRRRKTDAEPPDVPPDEQSLRIAEWIHAGRDADGNAADRRVPRTTLATPAAVVFGSRVDPRHRRSISNAR